MIGMPFFLLCTQAHKEDSCLEQHAPGTASRRLKNLASYSILILSHRIYEVLKKQCKKVITNNIKIANYDKFVIGFVMINLLL
jgi:hypothetical protein